MHNRKIYKMLSTMAKYAQLRTIFTVLACIQAKATKAPAGRQSDAFLRTIFAEKSTQRRPRPAVRHSRSFENAKISSQSRSKATQPNAVPALPSPTQTARRTNQLRQIPGFFPASLHPLS
ncbi:MAG: hypothetical protein QM715_20725 [Nibricoccus sp.]